MSAGAVKRHWRFIIGTAFFLILVGIWQVVEGHPGNGVFNILLNAGNLAFSVRNYRRLSRLEVKTNA